MKRNLLYLGAVRYVPIEEPAADMMTKRGIAEANFPSALLANSCKT